MHAGGMQSSPRLYILHNESLLLPPHHTSSFINVPNIKCQDNVLRIIVLIFSNLKVIHTSCHSTNFNPMNIFKKLKLITNSDLSYKTTVSSCIVQISTVWIYFAKYNTVSFLFWGIIFGKCKLTIAVITCFCYILMILLLECKKMSGFHQNKMVKI